MLTHRVIACLLGALQVLTVTVAVAEEVQEVVVTGAKRKFAPTDSSAATRIPMSVIETPQAISVVSSELMSITGANSLHTVAALAPGVVDQEGEIPVYIGVVARGFEVDWWNGNKIDGMPFMNSGSAIDFGIVDRLDVVRGPASIIYGQTDYGATLNIGLKKPQARRAVSGEFGTSSHGGHRALLDVTGAITPGERLRGRLVLIDDDTKTAQDLAFMEMQTVYGALAWDITDSTTLDLSFFHNERKGRRSYGFGLQQEADGGLSLPDVSPEAFIGAKYGINQGTMDFGVLRLTHQFSENWALAATAASHHTEFNWVEPFTYDFITPQNGGNLDLWDYWSADGVYDDSQDLTLTGKFDALGRSHSLVLSGYSRSNRENFLSACCEYLGTINVFDPQPDLYQQIYRVPDDPFNDSYDTSVFGSPFHDERKENGISALLLLHPAERWTAMLGVRYTDIEMSSVNYFDRSISRQTPQLYENDAVTKRVGLVYEVRPAMNVYASYSDGNIFHVNQSATGQPLTPETGEQWEVGAKAGLFNRKLTVSAAAFQLDRRDVAVHDPDYPANQPYSITVDGQKHKGFELEAIGEPLPGWNIISSYSYLDVAFKDDRIGAPGHMPANAPQDMLKLYTTYQVQGGALRGFSLGGGAFYVGQREVDNFGSFQLPAYTRVDLRLGYDGFENVSFSLNAINVGDEKIYTSPFNYASEGIAFQSRRTIQFRTIFKY